MINPLPVTDVDEMIELINHIGKPEFAESLNVEEQLYLGLSMSEFAGKMKGLILHKSLREGIINE